MLLANPSLEEIYHKSCALAEDSQEVRDSFQHPARLIKVHCTLSMLVLCTQVDGDVMILFHCTHNVEGSKLTSVHQCKSSWSYVPLVCGSSEVGLFEHVTDLYVLFSPSHPLFFALSAHHTPLSVLSFPISI